MDRGRDLTQLTVINFLLPFLETTWTTEEWNSALNQLPRTLYVPPGDGRPSQCDEPAVFYAVLDSLPALLATKDSKRKVYSIDVFRLFHKRWIEASGGDVDKVTASCCEVAARLHEGQVITSIPDDLLKMGYLKVEEGKVSFEERVFYEYFLYLESMAAFSPLGVAGHLKEEEDSEEDSDSEVSV